MDARYSVVQMYSLSNIPGNAVGYFSVATLKMRANTLKSVLSVFARHLSVATLKKTTQMVQMGREIDG